MFGYIQVYQPELKVRELEQYRGVYCTLCKRLGRRYGFFARLTLNYDFTFLALFRMALSPACPGFTNSHCTYLPTRRCQRCEDTASLDEAADLAMLMLYHKCRDDRHDGRFFRRLGASLVLPLLSLARCRAEKARPAAAAAMETYMTAQNVVEEARTPSVDAAAEPTAQLMATLVSAYATDEPQKRVLSRFGYCLGRWIYLADAVDDMEKDAKNGSYNPYVLSRGVVPGDAAALAAAREYGLGSLHACLAECCAAYELLEIHHFDGILRNVLLEGMPHTQRRITTSQAKEGRI